MPGRTPSQTKENKYPIDEIRPGEIGYIALPTHPNFGRPVKIIQQIQEGKQRWYLIEDLFHPDSTCRCRRIGFPQHQSEKQRLSWSKLPLSCPYQPWINWFK
jgi:hypothetical protein